VRLAIWPSARQSSDDVLEVARHADRTGWDGLYVADHFMAGGPPIPADDPNLEVTACLAAIAVTTHQIRLGPLVLGNLYRHPAVVANWAATFDHLAGGRTVLGIGAGWQRNEHEAYGIAFPRPGVRVDALDEACRAIRSLFDEPETTLHGQHYRMEGARCHPKPRQAHLPLLIGGQGDRMLGLVARHADEWNLWAGPELLRERGLVLDRRCDEIGRDPGTIRRSAQAAVLVTDDRAEATHFREHTRRPFAVAGPAGAFADFAAEMADAGVDELVVPDADLGRGAARLERMDALLEAVRQAVGGASG
jgi:alkanesulfonate monooxygenase SsuD/methylene tetrahydromethanopterin reductase-like flavin-dependent oxidoreductase (luciferase family)